MKPHRPFILDAREYRGFHLSFHISGIWQFDSIVSPDGGELLPKELVGITSRNVEDLEHAVDAYVDKRETKAREEARKRQEVAALQAKLRELQS